MDNQRRMPQLMMALRKMAKGENKDANDDSNDSSNKSVREADTAVVKPA